MKVYILSFFLLICSYSHAQNLSGSIRNQEDQSVANANVSLYNIKTKTIINQIKTESNGKFTFVLPAVDSIEIEVSHLQYKTYNERLAVKDVPENLIIELQPKTQEIDEIVVTGRSPQIYRKIDRLVFEVANSNISSLSGWDILKRTPLVNTQGDNILVRGSNNIVVLINEKRQLMTAAELHILLESTPGSEIQSIEVITNPPAKYEASGNAVINIKMKQVKSLGYKGSLYAKYEQNTYGKQLFGLTQNYKNEKFNVRASYYFGRGTYARFGTDVVNYPNDNTRWESDLKRVDKSNNQQIYNASAEFTPDSTLSMTIGMDGTYQPNANGIYQVPTLIYNQQGIVESEYHTKNDHHNFSSTNNIYFQLSKKLPRNTSLDWTNYYSQSSRNQFQDIQTELQFKDEPHKQSQFVTDNKYKTKLASSQLDFITKINTIDVEFGAKYSFVNSNNRMAFSDNERGQLESRPEKSSDFDYKEHNVAGYLSASYAYKKWQWKAGLRAEYTDLEGKVSVPEDINKNNYLTLFPTFYMQYQADNDAQYGFSYGKRINRPSYSWLNPAKSYYNQFSYFQGDPRLRATISHNLNLNYNHKNWVVDVFYNYEQWPNMEISYQDNQTNELIYHYTNIKRGQMAGISMNKSIDLTSFWNLYLDVTGLYNENIFIGKDKKQYKNDVYELNTRARTTFVLNKASDWNLELAHRYYSPSIQGTFTISQFSSTDIIMNRKFMNKKLDVGVFFLDIFKTEGTKIATKYANQDNYFLDYRDSRKFVLTMRYNFGNQTLKNGKTIKKTAEQNRL